MKAAETSASSAIADCTPLAVVSTTCTNIAIASSRASRLSLFSCGTAVVASTLTSVRHRDLQDDDQQADGQIRPDDSQSGGAAECLNVRIAKAFCRKYREPQPEHKPHRRRLSHDPQRA